MPVGGGAPAFFWRGRLGLAGAPWRGFSAFGLVLKRRTGWNHFHAAVDRPHPRAPHPAQLKDTARLDDGGTRDVSPSGD
ncbi:hypothetical protein GCM10018785_32530 [Streptomyces longispororuber]|uniref:Uncharacterized protein n=1 Tax=Streptomyces longispororuber TaxID=68230 RepID=A0A919DMR8_9ACTN|nr:hypothetical protein GCM10018785_32530 [Streptomyces longispororuber]